MDPLGLEPRASACFASSTFALSVAKAAIFQLIYEPFDVIEVSQHVPTLTTQRFTTSVGLVVFESSFFVLAVFRLLTGDASRSNVWALR